MGQKCRVCAHTKTKEIENLIVQGKPNTHIADMYGLDHQSVRYHSINHLPEKLVQAVQAERADHAENILDGINDLLQRTKKILDKAEADGHKRLALDAIKEARGTYELLSKIAIKLEEYRRKDQEHEEHGVREQIQDGLQALSTKELETYIALQSKIYAAQPYHELTPEQRCVVESMSRMWDSPVQEVGRESPEEKDQVSRRNTPPQDKISSNDRVSSPVEKKLEFEDLDLDLDDFDFDVGDQIPSEKTDPEWLVEWRKEKGFK